MEGAAEPSENAENGPTPDSKRMISLTPGEA